MSNAPRRAGRHFLQIPGPTPVPDRILRAMDMPVIDHRGPEFKALGLEVLSGIKTIFKTSSPVFIYPSSGTGAWEAALVNTLSPGDTVLMVTDGITEARVGGRLLGYEGMMHLANRSLTAGSLYEAGRAILEGARAFGGGSFKDDACLILARRRDPREG